MEIRMKQVSSLIRVIGWVVWTGGLIGLSAGSDSPNPVTQQPGSKCSLEKVCGKMNNASKNLFEPITLAGNRCSNPCNVGCRWPIFPTAASGVSYSHGTGAVGVGKIAAYSTAAACVTCAAVLYVLIGYCVHRCNQ